MGVICLFGHPCWRKLFRSDREHGGQENIWTVGEEATEGLRKLCDNKELRNLYPSPNIVRVMKWGGAVWCLAEVTCVF
jgi:hypothetical protein